MSVVTAVFLIYFIAILLFIWNLLLAFKISDMSLQITLLKGHDHDYAYSEYSHKHAEYVTRRELLDEIENYKIELQLAELEKLKADKK